MAPMANTQSGFVFTGKHMLAIIVAFFAVIITVNFTMAYFAVSTWSGLVVKNTYVASQEFNGKAAQARAWAATGIATQLSADKTGIRYEVKHPATGPITGERVVAQFRRPVGVEQDFTAELVSQGGGLFTTDHVVAPGQWIVDLETLDAGVTVYHEAIRIHVSGE